VSQAGQGHEAQRELEQHALRNASWLAEKLGYRDTLDKLKERRLVVVMVASLGAIILALGISAVMKDRADRDRLEQVRCEVDARVKVSGDVRNQVQRVYPSASAAERERIYEELVRNIAHAACMQASAK
jgi:hypothetical protein